MTRDRSPHESYLAVVLELLAREDCRSSIVENPLVVETLSQGIHDVDFLDLAIRKLTDFFRETGLPDARRLLFELIYEVRDDAVLVRLVQEYLDPVGGTSLVRRCLASFRRRDPKRVFSVISTILRSESESLAELAKVTALALCEDSGMLYLWASEDPASLLEPRTLARALGQAGTQTVTAAFRKLFTSLSGSEASGFVRAVPPGVEGAEAILFEALDFAAPEARIAAIERLGEFPTNVSVATLCGLLDNLNDTTEKFRPREAQATLKALASIERDDVQDYLERVRNQRNLLGHRYRRPIRRLLETLFEEASLPT